jgi:hypothetical protein
VNQTSEEIQKYHEKTILKLREEKKELIEALRGLFVSLKDITWAWTPESPYGIAAKVLEKHGRYWK